MTERRQARGDAHERARKRRLRNRLVLAAALAAVGLPVVAHQLIRRRVRPPQAPRWGRSHRYGGRHGAIAFQELGQSVADAPPLLLLHSFGPGYDSGQWRAAAEILASRHQVFAPDLPGWGRSEGGPLSPALYLDAIADFLLNVVREPAAVIAAGLPAAYALEVTAEHPRLVRALGLINPLGLGAEDGTDPAGFANATALARRLALRRLLRLPLVHATVLDLLTSRMALGRYLRHEAYAAPERIDAALLEQHYRSSHQGANRRALASYLRGNLGLNAASALPLLTQSGVPVWLAWGRAAQSPPVEDADFWLNRIPQARLDVLDGSAALPHAEVPVVFARRLEHFLSNLSAAHAS